MHNAYARVKGLDKPPARINREWNGGTLCQCQLEGINGEFGGWMITTLHILHIHPYMFFVVVVVLHYKFMLCLCITNLCYVCV